MCYEPMAANELRIIRNVFILTGECWGKKQIMRCYQWKPTSFPTPELTLIWKNNQPVCVTKNCISYARQEINTRRRLQVNMGHRNPVCQSRCCNTNMANIKPKLLRVNWYAKSKAVSTFQYARSRLKKQTHQRQFQNTPDARATGYHRHYVHVTC